MNTWHLLLILALAAALVVAGIRYSRPVLALAGFAGAACVAFGHLIARFGPELVWFRAPTFYIAGVMVLVGIVWWLRRPAPLKLRVGALSGAFALAAALLAFIVFHGRGTPPSMLMPTLRASAPDFGFVDVAGRSRRLSDFKGDVVLINFWATWCAPCRKEMPMLAKMQREYQPRRFSVLYLSLEEQPVLDAFLQNNHFDGIHGRIDAAPPFYDAGKFYPLSYLVSRDGRVIARWSGRPSERWLEGAIQREL